MSNKLLNAWQIYTNYLQGYKISGIILLLWTIGGIVSMAGSLTYVKLGIFHKVGILFYKKFLIIF